MDSSTISLLILSFITTATVAVIDPAKQNSPKDFLDAHNRARAEVGVKPLVWNDTVAKYALKYAQKRKGDCQMENSMGPYGENLAEGFGRLSAVDAVGMWVSEKPFYDYKSNSCVGDECSHYKQPESIMYRQYSSRNQRNKGIKVKHALQICLFLAVCFWLIYQVKRSHDTKNEFEESDAKGSLDSGSSGGLIKIGRKDIRPLYQEIVTANKLHNKAAEKEETTEVENNHEEAPDNKVDEALRNGDDETDLKTSEVDKLDTEVDQEEGNITDEGREDGIDSETGGETSDDGNGGKQDNSVEDGGHDGGDKSNHKVDDASSSVTHDNHTQTTENENNVTESVPELDHDQGIVTESTSTEGSNFKTSALQQANNSTLDVENHHSDSTSTDGTESINLESNLEDFSKPSNDTDSFTDTDSFKVVRIIRSEHSLEDGANTQMNETVSAKSDVSDGKDEVLESAITVNENPKEVHINNS